MIFFIFRDGVRQLNGINNKINLKLNLQAFYQSLENGVPFGPVSDDSLER